MPKKPTKRSRVKHASLKPRYNSRIRQEYLDFDYIDQLDDTIKNCKLPNGEMVTELQYLALFSAEWNNAEVGKQSEAENNIFHRTAAEVKDCTQRNNLRNNDTHGILRNKADRNNNKKLLNYDDILSDVESAQGHDPMRMENAYIDFLDNKQVESMIKEYNLAMEDFNETDEISQESQLCWQPHSEDQLKS